MSITKYGTAERDVAKTAEDRGDAVKAAEALREKPKPDQDDSTAKIERKKG